MTSEFKTELMVIVPHPDDEVFSAAGILRKCVDADKIVSTVTLTRGGAGRTLGLCTQEELPDLREKELRASLDILGVQEQHILDYPDGGLREYDAEVIVSDIVSRLESLKPKSIITFPPNGSNGHPDHVTTNKLVLASLEKSKHQPKSLYYYATETPYAGIVRPDFMHPDEVASMHLPPTHYLDMREYMEFKLRAMGQYESQARSVVMFMARLSRKLFFESFHRVRPEVKDSGAITVNWL